MNQMQVKIMGTWRNVEYWCTDDNETYSMISGVRWNPIDSTCEKCGETEGTELCPKCGAESYGNCPCKPKEEKIEIKLPNLNIKLPREILDPDSGHTEEFRHWAVQMTTSVNKLNKGDN